MGKKKEKTEVDSRLAQKMLETLRIFSEASKGAFKEIHQRLSRLESKLSELDQRMITFEKSEKKPSMYPPVTLTPRETVVKEPSLEVAPQPEISAPSPTVPAPEVKPSAAAPTVPSVPKPSASSSIPTVPPPSIDTEPAAPSVPSVSAPETPIPAEFGVEVVDDERSEILKALKKLEEI